MVQAQIWDVHKEWNECKLSVPVPVVVGGARAVLWGGHAGGSGGDGGSPDQQAGSGSTPACLVT